MTVSRSAILSSIDESIGPTILVDGCFPPSNDSLLLHISISLILEKAKQREDLLEIRSGVDETLCGFKTIGENKVIPCSTNGA